MSRRRFWRAVTGRAPFEFACKFKWEPISVATAKKWRSRESVADGSHRPHKLHTRLSTAQEAMAVELRRTLLLSLDDLLAVMREFVEPKLSRSGLDRCLRRHNVSNLKELAPKPEPPAQGKGFKPYEPGYVHVDVKYLPKLEGAETRQYLFVAIDRATRWVFVQIFPDKSARSAAAFLKALAQACPIRILKLLTDNGQEFTDKIYGSHARAPSGDHAFDRLCAALKIEHRLTPPRSPQTNGMVERFNGRIADVLRTHHFDSALDMEQTLIRYVQIYNAHIPQAALGAQTPLAALHKWRASHPHLFNNNQNNQAGYNT